MAIKTVKTANGQTVQYDDISGKILSSASAIKTPTIPTPDVPKSNGAANDVQPKNGYNINSTGEQINPYKTTDVKSASLPPSKTPTLTIEQQKQAGMSGQFKTTADVKSGYTVKGYDASGKAVYVKPNEYVAGISATPPTPKITDISGTVKMSDISKTTDVTPIDTTSQTKIYTDSLKDQTQKYQDQQQNNYQQRYDQQKALTDDLQKRLDALDPIKDPNYTETQQVLKNQLDAALEASNELTKNLKTRQGYVDSITGLMTDMQSEVNATKAMTGLSSILNPRAAQAQDTMTAKVAILQAGISAIDGQISTAQSYIDKAHTALTDDRNARIDYYNSLSSLDVLKKSEYKDFIQFQIDTTKSQIETSQAAYDNIKQAMTDPKTAQMYADAGITLNDSVEQINKKLSNYEYTQSNVTLDNTMQTSGYKFIPDNMLNTVTDKNSLFTVVDSRGVKRTYQNVGSKADIMAVQGGLYNTRTNQWVVNPVINVSGNNTLIDPTTGKPVGSSGSNQNVIVDSNGTAYDFSGYATDPTHNIQVQNIVSSIGKFNTLDDVNNYLNVNGSTFDGQQLTDAANKYGISWETLTGLIQQESNLGTSGVAQSNNNFGGITWSQKYQDSHPNTTKGTARPTSEGGYYVKFASSQDGLDAVAQQLSTRVAKATSAGGNDKEIIDGYVNNISSGTINFANVPAKYKTQVSTALNSGYTTYTPTAMSKNTLASERITAPYKKMSQYTLTADAQPYLERMDAAIKTPGSISDADLLDSLIKLNTGGNAITEAQVTLITNGQSFSDLASVASNKLKTGGVLSDSQRQQIVTMGKSIYENYKKGWQPIYDKVSKQLEDAGIPKQFWTIPDLNNLSTYKTFEDPAGIVGGNTKNDPAGLF